MHVVYNWWLVEKENDDDNNGDDCDNIDDDDDNGDDNDSIDDDDDVIWMIIIIPYLLFYITENYTASRKLLLTSYEDNY
jgi:hypothetical protein